jgi:hypothetical protein
MSPASAVARREEAGRFIGQVIEHLTEHSVSVWALKAQGSYVAYGVNPAAWPVGTVVDCRLADDGTYVDKLDPVSEDTVAEYRSKLLIR